MQKIDSNDPRCEEARRLHNEGWAIRKIAKHLKMGVHQIARCLKVETNGAETSKGTDNESELSFLTTTPIRTLEEACAAAKVDLSVWYVDSWECSQWTVGMNVKEGKTSRPVQTQQYRVKVRLKRIIKKSLREAIDAVYTAMRTHAPKFKIPRIEQSGVPTLAVTCLFDTHFGKLSWSAETGEDYDLKIAQNLFRNAVIDLINYVKDRKIARFLLPLGNDFFHIDNRRNTTFLGTPQDTDSRYAKIFLAGKLAVIWAIEHMLRYANVDVLWVPGNHDPTTSYHLAETISSWFHKTKGVTVDVSPPMRKYYRWDDILLGFTHGDKLKPESLPNLMATERPMDWGETTCREWLLGHNHRAQRWTTKEVDTHAGTTVRTIQALTATDAWHHEQGFINSNRAAEVLLYQKGDGYVGNLIAKARLE